MTRGRVSPAARLQCSTETWLAEPRGEQHDPTSSEGAGWVSSVLTELQQALPVGLIHQPLPLVGGAILVVHLSPAAPLAVAPLALVELPVGVKERPPALDSSTDMAG